MRWWFASSTSDCCLIMVIGSNHARARIVNYSAVLHVSYCAEAAEVAVNVIGAHQAGRVNL